MLITQGIKKTELIYPVRNTPLLCGGVKTSQLPRGFKYPAAISNGIYLFLGIVVLAFVFFGNGIKGQFVYDDQWVIGLNPTVSQISQIPRQFVSSYHYLQPSTGLYRPLTIISYTFNFLFGKGPAGFHMLNILLYAANAFLVFILIFKLFGSKRLAYISTVLFFFLPIHVEAVTFISGRADLLAFFFALVALLLLFEQRYWLGSLAFLLSLLSKESAVLFVPLVFAFWLWIHPVKSGEKVFLYFLPAAMVYGLLRFAALKEYFLNANTVYIVNPIVSAKIFERFYTSLKVMTLYLWKMFVPLHLSADYSFNQIPLLRSPFNYYVISGLLLLLIAIFAIFWKKTKTTPFAFGAIMFLSSYFVISNFIFPIGTIMAERTFYLPSLGVVLMVALALDKLMSWKFRKFWLAILILFCAFYGLIIFNRNTAWADPRSLYESMVKESPNSLRGKALLGILDLQNNKWDEGKQLLEDAYRIAQDDLTSLDGLGIVAQHEGRYADAEHFYSQALKINPDYSTARFNLGRMYFQLKQYDKVAEIFKQRLVFKPDPGSAVIYTISKSKLGKYDEAISVIKKYYGDNPADINLKFALGYAYYKKGDKATADIYFKQSKNPAISNEEFIKSMESF